MGQSLFSWPQGQKKAPTVGTELGMCVLQMMGAQELWSPAALHLLLHGGVGVRLSQADSDGSFRSRLREAALHGKDSGWETVERFLETANVTSRVLREGKRCWENS